MRCHEIDYEIIGESMQMVEVELDPRETVIAEAGAMNYMESGIEFEAKMGDGSEPEQGFMSKLFSAGKRMISGESLFMTHFTNSGHGKKRVAFAAPFPGFHHTFRYGRAWWFCLFAKRLFSVCSFRHQS